MSTKFVFNPLNKLWLDKVNSNIPDGIPTPWDASGWTFPVVVVWTPDRWVISDAWTLPAPVWAVLPWDYIIYDWANWTVIHAVVSPSISESNVIVVNVNEPEIEGKQYQNLGNINTYIDNNFPSDSDIFSVLLATPIYDIQPQYKAYSIVGTGTPTVNEAQSYIDYLSFQDPKSITAPNYIKDLQVNSINPVIIGTPNPITFQINRTADYASPVRAIKFSTTPTTGNYKLYIDTNATWDNWWNNTAVDLQNEIRNLWAAYSQIEVQGDYTDQFIIVFKGFAGNSTPSISIADNTDGWLYQSLSLNGTTEIQTLVMSNLATQWERQIGFTYVVDPQHIFNFYSWILSYNADDAAITAELQVVLQQVYNQLGIDWWLGTAYVTIQNVTDYVFNFDGAKESLLSKMFFGDPALRTLEYTITAHSCIKADGCIIKWFLNGGTSLEMNGGKITAGDYTGIGISMILKNVDVVDDWPVGISSKILSYNSRYIAWWTEIALHWGTFRGDVFENVNLYDGEYNFYWCDLWTFTFNPSQQTPSDIIINVFGGTGEINIPNEYIMVRTYWFSGSVSDYTGQWLANDWVAFNPANTDLTSLETAWAIREIRANQFVWDIATPFDTFYNIHNIATIQWPIMVTMKGDTDFTGGIVFNVPAGTYTNMGSVTFFGDKTKADPSYPIYGAIMFTQQWVTFDAMPNLDWVTLACLDTIVTNTNEFIAYYRNSFVLTMDVAQWGTGNPAIVLTDPANDITIISEDSNIANPFNVPFIDNRCMAKINIILKWTSDLWDDAITATGTWPGTVGDLIVSLVDSGIKCWDLSPYNIDGTLSIEFIEDSSQIDFTVLVSSLTSKNVRDAIEELWGMIGSWGWVSKSSEILINATSWPDIPWKQYQLVADANSYINTIPATVISPWNIWLSGDSTEPVINKLDYVSLFGDGMDTTILRGNLTLDSAVELDDICSNIYRLTIDYLSMGDKITSLLPITYNSILSQPYVPHTYSYSFRTPPTSGTYTISVGIFETAPLAFDADATEIQTAITGLSSTFSEIIVTWDVANGFTIEERGFSANSWVPGMPGITVNDIDVLPNWAYAKFSGTLAGMTTPVVVTADNIWAGGNNVTINFDWNMTVSAGIALWNLMWTSNTVTLTSWDGNQTPNNKEKMVLSDWVDVGAIFNQGWAIGATQSQVMVFSDVPTTWSWKVQFAYNGNAYISSWTLDETSQAWNLNGQIQDVFSQILLAEWIDLGVTNVSTTWDFANGFITEFLWYPGATNDLVNVCPMAPGAYASFTGTVLVWAVPWTPFTVTANNSGIAGNITINWFTGVAGDTIDSRITDWNNSNPSNQITLISGDWTQVPDFKQQFKLFGWEDSYIYSLVWGWSVKWQRIKLTHVRIKNCQYSGTLWEFVSKDWVIDGGDYKGFLKFNVIDWEVTNGKMPNSAEFRNTKITGGSYYGWIFYGGSFDLSGCTIGNYQEDWVTPAVYRFYGTTFTGGYNGQAVIFLHGCNGGTFDSGFNGYIQQIWCTDMVFANSGGQVIDMWDVIDLTGSIVTAYNVNDAIRAALLLFTAQSWTGVPTSATPRFVWDKYMDTTDMWFPLRYVAYGTSIGERQQIGTSEPIPIWM